MLGCSLARDYTTIGGFDFPVDRTGADGIGVVRPGTGKPTSDGKAVVTAKGTGKGKARGKSQSPTSTSTPPEGTTDRREVPEVDDNSVVTEEVPEVEREWSKTNATGLLQNYYASIEERSQSMFLRAWIGLIVGSTSIGSSAGDPTGDTR